MLGFFTQIAFVLAVCDNDAKREMNLLCCIFLHSCKAERKKKGNICIFFAGFSGFFFCKNVFPFSFLINDVLLRSLFF